MTQSWTGDLWTVAEGTYGAILDHPFVEGLTSGTLEEASFAYYVVQDAHYLRDYARTLAIVGAKAPTHADTGLFATHAAETVEVELALHETLLPELGLDPAVVAGTTVSPTTTGYTSYLLATAYGGSFAEGLAAVLPCYWIYARVGAALVEKGSPDPRYQRWIDTYAGDAFAATVADVLALADRGRDSTRRGRRGPGPRALRHDRPLRMDVLGRGLAARDLADLSVRRPGLPRDRHHEEVPANLNHTTICASDFAASLAFYDAALGALGLVRAAEFGDEEEEHAAVEAAGWGPADAAPLVWLVAAQPPTRGAHLALRAGSRAEVEAFYAAALQAGGRAYNAPRRWAIFRRGEFNAVVGDPDGNRLEAVAAE